MKRLLAALLAVPALLVATSAPALAAEPVVELSRDGITWGQNIDEPLFDPAMRWVPGDSETASFFVRNQGGTAGDLAIDVIGSRSGELLDSGDLRITARGGGGDWQTVTEPGVHRLLTALDVADGKVAKISVNVAFDGGSLAPTQLEAASFAFKVTLSRALSLRGDGAGDSNGSGDGSDGDMPSSGPINTGIGGLLPGTGAPELRWGLAVAAVLLGAGSAIIVASRREGSDV